MFKAANKGDSFCALRTLGELYVVLTRLPYRPRITGPEAIRLMHQVRERLTVVSLGETEYLRSLQASASSAIIGAAAYDGLIARSALVAGADTILTWNTKDFLRLGVEMAGLVRTPE